MPLRKTKHKSDEVTRIAYRFLALPDDEQKIMFSKTFGCVRYLYNRMLDDKSKAYKNFGEKLNLNSAFTNFYEGRADYPKFKKKNDHHDSYTTNMVNGNIRLRYSNHYMYLSLPKIPGEVKIRNHRPIRQGGTLKSVTVSRVMWSL